MKSNNISNLPTVSKPEIDEEVFSRQMPPTVAPATKEINIDTRSLPPGEAAARLNQAGQRSRSTLTGSHARAQIANLTDGISQSQNLSDGITDSAGMTNARFQDEPSIAAVLAGGVLPKKGEGVKRVQQALADLGFTVKGGADGVYGLGTRSVVQQFQREQNLAVTGQVDAATIKMLDRVSPSAGQTAKLGNSRFSDDARLQQILTGGKPLSRTDGSETVKRVQQALTDMGFSGSLYGVDGSLGGETARLIKSFQRAQQLPMTGALDRATLRELDRLAPMAGQKLEKFPEYERMFADGILNTTFAVGFDEDGWHVTETSELRNSLKTDGYRELNPTKSADADLLRKAGYDPASLPTGIVFYNKPFTYNGKKVESLVQFINPDTPEAAKKFENGMVKSDLVVYMGHARYGTGPDFDTKESTAGNYVIGVNSALHKAGKVKSGYDAHMNEILKNSPNNLEQTKFESDRYQMMAFFCCQSVNYADEMRNIPVGKDDKNLDFVGSNELIYWNNMAASGMATLKTITDGQSINNLQSRLHDIHNIENGFYADGFGDNP